MSWPARHWTSCAIALLAVGVAVSASGKPAREEVFAFVGNHCVECHDSDTKKGGLDLSSLKWDLADTPNFATWAKVADRVSAGEMPPKKKARPPAAETKRFTNDLSSALLTADRQRVATQGRAVERRLNRYEYEETLRDLLGLPYLEVKSFLPEDGESHGFNKVGTALDVSHVQMNRYLSAAEFALHEAMAPRSARPALATNRYYTWDQGAFFGAIKLEGPLVRRTFPLVGYELQTNLMAMERPRKGNRSEDKNREQEALAVVVSTYEPTEIHFDRFRAPVDGKYHLRFCAYSVWLGPGFKSASPGRRSEPVTIYADTPPRILRKLGSFDVNPEPTVREIDAYLLAGETIRPDAARFFRSRPPDQKNPLETPEGMPGLAFGWMEVEGPLIDQWPPPGEKLLFGDLPMKDRESSAEKRGHPAGVEVISKQTDADAERLLRAFLQKTYLTPVADTDVRRFLSVIEHALRAGYNFTDSMIAGYTAVLSSPGFLYFHENPGRLDDVALAARLSYFLWNSRPDAELLQLAKDGKLHRPKVLRQQTDRLLNDPRSRRFINAFLDYWLDLRLIEGTAPDTELYPDYQLDDLLVESMTAETQLFFNELVKNDLGVTNLVESRFAMLNERLARHYGIDGVNGVELRPVALPPDSVRGGLLTQASVLKVTSNGTTTSPVKRGVWIMTRLLGKPPPPPPPNVPALEPDTRGATTIREQLAKHRAQETCAACHRNIDPPGFALESFDVMGGWRDSYRVMSGPIKVKGVGHNGLRYHFCQGAPVDCSGELSDGEKFADVRQLKDLLVKDDEQLARNLVRQLTVYATGAGIQYSDRPQITKILARTREKGYGVRSIIHEIVQSDMFLSK